MGSIHRNGGGVLPIMLPSGRTTAVFGDHGRTVCARQRPTQTPSNTLVRICKAGVESSILFVSTGSDLRTTGGQQSRSRDLRVGCAVRAAGGVPAPSGLRRRCRRSDRPIQASSRVTPRVVCQPGRSSRRRCVRRGATTPACLWLCCLSPGGVGVGAPDHRAGRSPWPGGLVRIAPAGWPFRAENGGPVAC